MKIHWLAIRGRDALLTQETFALCNQAIIINLKSQNVV